MAEPVRGPRPGTSECVVVTLSGNRRARVRVPAHIAAAMRRLDEKTQLQSALRRAAVERRAVQHLAARFSQLADRVRLNLVRAGRGAVSANEVGLTVSINTKASREPAPAAESPRAR